MSYILENEEILRYKQGRKVAIAQYTMHEAFSIRLYNAMIG